jgi:hypothetical protein
MIKKNRAASRTILISPPIYAARKNLFFRRNGQGFH